MSEPGERENAARFERGLNVLGSIIAPATLLGALLFYFGYVSSRAQYDYFGIDVDVIGLNTQDYVMRSPQPLLVPLLVFALVGAALIAWHAQIRRRSSRSGFAVAGRRGVVVGLGILAVGLILLFAYPLLAEWDYYPLVTPLIVALGGAIAAYCVGTVRFLARETGVGHRPPTGVVVLLWAAVAACVFWATATVAQWSGLGLAQQQARAPDNLPSVIVDTEQRLFLPDEARVSETALPALADETFRFRYWGLRLLIVGDDRMFLIPNAWDNHNTTLVLPLDGSVRLQFQFRNLEP
ncbi:hypothetical protein [Cryobacterium luteum]|uniref:Uncharacterized protein n=1 Tax=Cryobacterium luteum TaxID=1424661 RepID=A0A1H8F202_9MICO|nr:hypothetical protein [Cryobacterium luteum]TFB85484.1 hypothetical protein E3O10_15230 [Cryobacterium luteum]SEN25749.1 hypothetical protein SAMN05216281_105158 [Cryobacterium luteum]